MWLQMVIGWCVGSPLVAILVGKVIAAGARLHPVPSEPSGVLAFGSDSRVPAGSEARSTGLPQAA